jgi:hypothetical protein
MFQNGLATEGCPACRFGEQAARRSQRPRGDGAFSRGGLVGGPLKRRKRPPEPRRPAPRQRASAQPRPARKAPGEVATNVPGGDAVQAVVAKLSAPLLELWAQFWPFGKKVPYLSVLSGDVPMAVLDTFPLDRPETISAIFESVVRERQAIVEGRNERFEQLVTELAPLGIPREKLVELTNFPLLPAYRWAIDRSDQIEAVRPAATKLERQLQVVRRRLVAASPQLTAVIVDRLDLLLRYLDGIPTKGSLRQWRRAMETDRLDANCLRPGPVPSGAVWATCRYVRRADRARVAARPLS